MKVILHKLFPYAPYLNEYIGFEMDIPDDGNPIAEVETLRKLAEQSHRERYPHLYPNGSEAMIETFEPPVQKVQKDSKESATERMLLAINTCTELKVLETFKLLVKNNPVFQEAYNKKENELQ